MGPRVRTIIFAVFLALNLVALLWPRLRVEGPVPRPDLWIHLLGFGLIALVAWWSRVFGPTDRWPTIARVLIFGVAFGALTEALQLIPALGRTGALDDWAADCAGVILGLIVPALLTALASRRDPGAARETLSPSTPDPGTPAPNHPGPTTSPTGPTTEPDALGGAVRATGLMTLASRVFGLVRDVLIGRLFGDTLVGSAFAAAFAIPNMFRRLFGEGALSAAFLPPYAQASKHQPDLARALAAITLRWLGLVTGALTVIIELGLLAALIALPPDPQRDLSLKLVMVMLPFMPLVCCTAILAGMLQVHGRFAAAASGPIVLNAMIILTGAYFLFTGRLATTAIAYALGVATVASGLTQMIAFWLMLRRLDAVGPPPASTNRSAPSPAEGRARAEARTMLRAFVPVLVGLGTLQLSTFLDTLIAMWPIWVGPTVLGFAVTLDERSNAILSLTSRLYQFPLGVFGIAVATAAFPLMSRAADLPADFTKVLRRALRMSFLIALPASVGLALVRTDLVTVMFGGGATGFSPEGLARASDVLLAYSLGVWAYALNHVLTRAFYARKDTKTPMRVSLAMVAVNLAVMLVLVWPLREAGLAWATALCATLQTLVLATLARSRLGLRGPDLGLFDAPTLRAMARTLALGLVMGLAVWAAELALDRAVGPPARWADHALRIGVGCATGLCVYLGGCLLLRVPELGWLVRRSAR
jgi:putative peptidoglycan lipid II flippase